ncbi:Protein hgh1 [Coemansia sp. RSA 2399]|nr:Protein hgh1 [Coemansia sp. RSA 2399]KAJ1902806.1 Protein hgh1 [Coemansia sp. IMI 209127]
MAEQLDELVEFLNSPRPDVRELAVSYLTGFSSPGSDNFQSLVSRADRLVQKLLVISHETPVAANSAMSILVNMTTDTNTCKHFADEDHISMIIRLIVNPACIVADLAAMLLSNITKLEPICRVLSLLKVSPASGICNSPLALDQLTDVFVKGMDKKYNKNAHFGYLASVFADVTNYPYGRRYFLERTAYDGKLPITKIMVFSEYPEVIRRGGVDSTMKNVCFDKEKHREILDPQETNLLPYIIRPLCGPEEYEMEEMEHMPEEVQFLGDDKKRESDPRLRATLLEAVNLLCTTYDGREVLRAKKIYPILREMHKAETDETCLDLSYRAVQLLLGDESKETKDDGGEKADADTFEEI